jgi:hypothetical protein
VHSIPPRFSRDQFGGYLSTIFCETFWCFTILVFVVSSFTQLDQPKQTPLELISSQFIRSPLFFLYVAFNNFSQNSLIDIRTLFTITFFPASPFQIRKIVLLLLDTKFNQSLMTRKSCCTKMWNL